MTNHAAYQKRVVMVLGMARCGTSTIARGLSAIGVDLGDKLLRPDQRNPTGFFEDTDVTFKINRGLLRTLNYPWICHDLAERMQRHDDHVLNEFKDYALHLVQERLAGNDCWGFKDTNTTVFLPFWQSVLSAAGVEDNYVIALRNPLGCAYSNIKHSNLTLEAGLLEWLKNMMLAVNGSRGKKCVVVSYDLLLNDPLRELLRMRHYLEVDTASQNELDAYASKFVDKKLHHHAYTDNDLINDPAMAAVPLCLPVYQLLKEVASDALSLTDDAFLTAWLPLKKEFEHRYPVYEYVNSLRKENLQLERKIRTIRKSLPWKLLYPVRVLSTIWHSKKRHRKYSQNTYE